MKKAKLLILIFFILTIITNVNSKEDIKILYKINNEIITNIDIKNEAKYLIALNNQLNSLEEKKIIAIAKDSIIKEKIKRIELLRYYDLNQKNKYLDKLVKNFYIKLGLENESQFEKYLDNYNLSIIKLKKKFEIESTWNQLIYDRYKTQINIDKKKLRRQINQNKMAQQSKQYLLSEIIVEKSANESFNDKIVKIKKSIKEIGFKNTANTYSIADSSKFGGDIGWINEINLSKKIAKYLKVLNIGETTEPILIGKNFLILKLEDLKEETIKINKDEMLKRLIESEQDRQLNQFSAIYFNKVKINTYINEL